MSDKKRLTRGQAIKQYCKADCCNGSNVDWKECPATNCPLYPYRLGRVQKKPYVLPINSEKNSVPAIRMPKSKDLENYDELTEEEIKGK